MSSYVGSRIQIDTREGKYEGILSSIDPVTKLISIKQAIALPSGQKYLGLLNFYGQEISELRVIGENEIPPAPLVSSQEQDIPPARSYEDPDNPEIFDDYQQGNQQAQSYSEDWGYDPAPAYSEEVTIQQETEQNGQDVYSADPPDKDVCEGFKDLSLNNNGSPHPPQHTSPPKIQNDTNRESDPKEYIIINQHDDVFDQAIADIEQQSAIGLVLKGSKLGRKGKLSLVLVLCGEQVYMFDALALPSLFTRKFIAILQADDITKVMHDCRFASDLLYHHYGIQLGKIFDTQVGDIFIKKRQYHGDFPRQVSGTTQCILEYLEIRIHDIAMHLEMTQRIEEDEDSWLQRPLSPANIRCALLDTRYLLRLQEAITVQLLAEFTCAIDIYRSVERDRLEVDLKKLSSRASYVPRELINGLRSRVDQMMISSSRVKPKELSHLPSSSSSKSSSQVDWQSPPRGPSSKGNAGAEKLRLPPCGYQKTSPATSAKPSWNDPPRPPTMLGGTAKEHEANDDDVLSVSSEDSEEAFGGTTEKELWQQRYTKNIKPVTLLEALNAKELEEEEEEEDDTMPRLQDDSFHDEQKGRTVERTVPPRTAPAEAAVSDPKQTIAAGRATDDPSADNRLGFPGPKDSSDAAVSDHPYSQKPASFVPPKLTELRQHNENQRQRPAMQAKSTNRQEDIQTHRKSTPDTMPSQASYVDVLLGKRNDEALKIKANRTLKAIGKALATGHTFSTDEEEETAADDSAQANKHNGFDGYTSYSRGYPELGGHSKPRPERKFADESPPRTIGRGRASLVDHQSYVLNPRQSQMQSRVAGGLGMRTAGELRSVQVDFPTAEEMESAPESVPIPAGSAFLSQRVIIPR